MNLIETLMIAMGLAMDAGAVSMAAAAAGYAATPRAVFRLSFHFGLFQFFMPVIGWFLGIYVVHYVARVDHWIAFLLLAFVGIRMIRSGLEQSPAGAGDIDPSKGVTLVLLSVATSIDAMAVGLSLAMIKVSIWFPSVIIGIVTIVVSIVSIAIGKRMGVLFGSRMEIAGGLILLAIGGKILWTH